MTASTPRIAFGLVLWAALAVPGPRAQEARPDPSAAQDPAPADRGVHPTYEEMVDRYDAAYREWRQQLRTAQGDARRHISANPPKKAFLPRFRAAAEAHAGTDAAVPFLIWVCMNAGFDEAAATAKTIVEQHGSDPRSAQIARRLGSMSRRLGRDEVCSMLTTLVEHAEGESRAQALMARAMLFYGTTGVAETEAQRRGAVADLEAALACATVKGTRDRVQKMAYEATHLEPGMTAPDIEGEDLDGVAFKLSDYRGKVVLLDFWGDW